MQTAIPKSAQTIHDGNTPTTSNTAEVRPPMRAHDIEPTIGVVAK